SRGYLAGERAREAEDSGLCRAIVDRAGARGGPHDRAHVDDLTGRKLTALAAHELQRFARAIERPIEMDPQHAVPLLVRKILREVAMGFDPAFGRELLRLRRHDFDVAGRARSLERDPGIVDEHVETLRLPAELSEHAPH